MNPRSPVRPLLPYALALIALQAVLVAAYLALPRQTAFDLDGAHTAWTWLSSIQLAAVAAVLLLARRAEQTGGTGTPPLSSYWWLLALGFFLLSADEVLSIHERLGTRVAHVLLPNSLTIRDIIPWQVILAPAVFLAFAALLAMTFSRLTAIRSARTLALLGLALFVLALTADRAARPYFASIGAPRAAVLIKEWPQLLAETCLLFAFGSYVALRFRRHVPIATVRVRTVLATAGALVAAVSIALVAVTMTSPAFFHSRLAENLADAGNHAGALAAYERALRSAPDDAELWHALGLSALRARDYSRAADAFLREAELQPDDPKAHGFMGIAAFLQSDLDAARAAYQRAIALDPGYARAHRNLAWVYERRREDRRAEEQYRLALASDAAMADVHRYLGDLLARNGRAAEAAEHWRQSLELDPAQQDAALLTQRVAEKASDAAPAP